MGDELKEFEKVCNHATGALLSTGDRDDFETGDKLSKAWVALKAELERQRIREETARRVAEVSP